MWIGSAASDEERQQREVSDFCNYRNAAGEFLDFHALRHTRCTWLFQIEGLNPREVQELMSVSSLALVDRCSRSHKRATEIAIGPGPDLSAPPEFTRQRATGTDGRQADDAGMRLASCLASNHDVSGHERSQTAKSVENARVGISRSKNNENTLVLSGGGGIRTPETLAGLPVFKTGAINRSATPPAIGRVRT